MIGGGDGGVVRELDKHPLVKYITQCEIDKVRADLNFRHNQRVALNSDTSLFDSVVMVN